MQINAHTVRVTALTIFYPLTDRLTEKAEDFQIKGLQFISEDSRKIFPLPFMGLFHIASAYERSKDIVVIVEVYATARSLAIALDTESIPSDSCNHNTGSKNFLVIVAMFSVNVKPVAEKIFRIQSSSLLQITMRQGKKQRNPQKNL